jgi:hypothetical protein
VNTCIELHDSVLADIAAIDGLVTLWFRPAYIHSSECEPGLDKGFGSTQDAAFAIAAASSVAATVRTPAIISEGSLRVGNHLYKNLIPIRSNFETPVVLCLVLATGETILIAGERIIINLEGTAKFVEEFNP